MNVLYKMQQTDNGNIKPIVGGDIETRNKSIAVAAEKGIADYLPQAEVNLDRHNNKITSTETVYSYPKDVIISQYKNKSIAVQAEKCVSEFLSQEEHKNQEFTKDKVSVPDQTHIKSLVAEKEIVDLQPISKYAEEYLSNYLSKNYNQNNNKEETNTINANKEGEIVNTNTINTNKEGELVNNFNIVNANKEEEFVNTNTSNTNKEEEFVNTNTINTNKEEEFVNTNTINTNKDVELVNAIKIDNDNDINSNISTEISNNERVIDTTASSEINDDINEISDANDDHINAVLFLDIKHSAEERVRKMLEELQTSIRMNSVNDATTTHKLNPEYKTLATKPSIIKTDTYSDLVNDNALIPNTNTNSTNEGNNVSSSIPLNIPAGDVNNNIIKTDTYSDLVNDSVLIPNTNSTNEGNNISSSVPLNDTTVKTDTYSDLVNDNALILNTNSTNEGNNVSSSVPLNVPMGDSNNETENILKPITNSASVLDSNNSSMPLIDTLPIYTPNRVVEDEHDDKSDNNPLIRPFSETINHNEIIDTAIKSLNSFLVLENSSPNNKENDETYKEYDNKENDETNKEDYNQENEYNNGKNIEIDNEMNNDNEMNKDNEKFSEYNEDDEYNENDEHNENDSGAYTKMSKRNPWDNRGIRDIRDIRDQKYDASVTLYNVDYNDMRNNNIMNNMEVGKTLLTVNQKNPSEFIIEDV